MQENDEDGKYVNVELRGMPIPALSLTIALIALAHLPFHTGFLFSRNAFNPSTASSVFMSLFK